MMVRRVHPALWAFQTMLLLQFPRDVQSFTPYKRADSCATTTTTTLFGLSIGLGPSEDEVKEPARKDVLVAGVDYEIPDHEAHRLDRRTKLDERCDEWFTELLNASSDEETASCFGSIAKQMRERLATVPVLRNEYELEDPNDPNWTPYVSTELPWSILRPAFGLEYYGLPIPRRNAETWRHFDVASMVAAPMDGSLRAKTVDTEELQAKLTRAAGWVPDEDCAARLVYVNGIFVPELSKQLSSDGTAVVENIDSIERFNDEERTFVSRLTDGWTDDLVAPVPVMYGDPLTSFKSLSGPNHCVGDPDTQFAINSQQGTACFAALNTIQARNIAFVNVTSIMDDKPIVILHSHTQNGGIDDDDTAGVALHPRTVIMAHATSAADIVQQSVSLDDDDESLTNSKPILVNGYTQICIKDHANISHSFVEESGGLPIAGMEDANDTVRQEESDRPASQNTILETLDVHCAGADSHYSGTMVSMGGNGRVRTASSISLLQPGASCRCYGFSLNGGKCRTDIKTNIHHIANECTSEQLQKNMVGGRSTTSFRGRIRVEQAAQQTDSQQLSRTVLLTDKAAAWAVPSLEIIADDVQCTHGATVSDLSEEELFYLQSRGINLSAARNILMYAFCNDVMDAIPFSIRGEMRGMREESNGLSARLLKRLDNLVPTGKRAIRGEFQSI